MLGGIKLQFLPYGISIGSWICLTHKTYTCHTVQNITDTHNVVALYIDGCLGFHDIRGLLEKYPTFGREKETGLLGALDT
jgi:hypothetical protein